MSADWVGKEIGMHERLEPKSVLVTRSDALVTSSFLLLVVRRLLLVAMPGATSSFLFLVAMHLLLVASLLLVVRPGAPSSVLAPTSERLEPKRCFCV